MSVTRYSTPEPLTINGTCEQIGGTVPLTDEDIRFQGIRDQEALERRAQDQAQARDKAAANGLANLFAGIALLGLTGAGVGGYVLLNDPHYCGHDKSGPYTQSLLESWQGQKTYVSPNAFKTNRTERTCVVDLTRSVLQLKLDN